MQRRGFQSTVSGFRWGEEVKNHIFCTKTNCHFMKNYVEVISPLPGNSEEIIGRGQKLLKKSLSNENYIKIQLKMLQ